MLKLKHIINSVVVAEYDLTEGEFVIGRNDGNDLQLEDGVVSGEHTRLVIEQNEYLPEMLDVTIIDLDSTNGTIVNGNKITEAKLKHDDVVRIGSNEFKVFDERSNTGTQTEYYVPDED